MEKVFGGKTGESAEAPRSKSSGAEQKVSFPKKMEMQYAGDYERSRKPQKMTERRRGGVRTKPMCQAGRASRKKRLVTLSEEKVFCGLPERIYIALLWAVARTLLRPGKKAGGTSKRRGGKVRRTDSST